MKIFLYIAFTFSLFSVFGQNEMTNVKDENERKQGHWTIYGKDRPELKFPPDGKVEEGDYIDDRKTGIWTKYYEDGKTIKLVGEYQRGHAGGKYKKFWPNGKLKEIGTYTQSKNLDSLKRFYDNGQLEYEAWFNEDGKEEGFVNWYYEIGQLEHTWCAKNGVPYDAYHYDQLGNLISSQPTPIVCPEPKRDIKPVTPEEAAKHPVPHTSETPNTRTIPFKRDGYNKVYNDDNEILLDGVFKGGQLLDGKHYEYDRDGILLNVRIFKNGVYHSEGKL